MRLLGDYASARRSVLRVLQGPASSGDIILPVPEIDATVAVLKGFASAENSPLLVDDSRLGALPADTRDAARAKIPGALEKTVTPSFERLKTYVDGAYRDGAPSGVGQAQYPGGAEYYRWLVKRSTTLDMTPEQIHELGLQEVQRLRTELDGVRKSVHFNGDVDAFLTYLKTDPRFFATSSDEIGEN